MRTYTREAGRHAGMHAGRQAGRQAGRHREFVCMRFLFTRTAEELRPGLHPLHPPRPKPARTTERSAVSAANIICQPPPRPTVSHTHTHTHTHTHAHRTNHRPTRRQPATILRSTTPEAFSGVHLLQWFRGNRRLVARHNTHPVEHVAANVARTLFEICLPLSDRVLKLLLQHGHVPGVNAQSVGERSHTTAINLSDVAHRVIMTCAMYARLAWMNSSINRHGGPNRQR